MDKITTIPDQMIEGDCVTLKIGELTIHIYHDGMEIKGCVYGKEKTLWLDLKELKRLVKDG